MKGHGQFCPVAVASEVFAHRWTPLILRELLAGSSQFNEIRRCLPLISKTTLADRLRALEYAGVVACDEKTAGSSRQYRLTAAGLELKPVLVALGTWGQRWTARVDAQNLDADLLMWNVRRRLAVDHLPPGSVVVRFDFSGLPANYRRTRIFWLIIEDKAAELCIRDPGLEVDLQVNADLKSFVRVWLGDIAMADALRNSSIRLSGQRELVRQFPSWLLRSPFADVPRPVSASA
jgi:DNA-binding HxlR family transcriptional regulator